MKTKFIKIITIGIGFITLFGCGKEISNTSKTNENPSDEGAAISKNVNANLLQNSNSNSNVKIAENNSPKRISFNKGANWGAVNITLTAGAAQKFVVGAKSGQTMEVETSSKGISINLIKGKAETTEDFGFLNAELLANGEYIFEVKNSTKKELKTSVKVTISGGSVKQNEIDPTDTIVFDDDTSTATDKN